MEELEQAIFECGNPDCELHYKPIEEKARYILSIAKIIIAKETERDYDGYIEDLINGVQV